MKKIILTSFILFVSNVILSQEIDSAKVYVRLGVKLHDQGKYNEALIAYEKAIHLDSTNIIAFAEKAYSLVAIKKYDAAIDACINAINIDPVSRQLKIVYATFGNALDKLNKPNEAIQKYNIGLRLFPNFYLLHYNKAITLYTQKKDDDALVSFQNAVIYNPNHASSHAGIATLMLVKKQKIPALLAINRLLILEPQSNRAKNYFLELQKIMSGNIDKTGDNSITINIDPDILKEDAAKKENNFNTAELILSMAAALDHDEKNKNKTKAELFSRKFKTICGSLEETANKNTGFFWKYYAPYFIELNQKGHIETLANIVHVTTKEEPVLSWLDTHKEKINTFYKWSNMYWAPKKK